MTQNITPPSDDPEKDPLDVLTDAVRAGREDLRASRYTSGGAATIVHIHPSTVKDITHETDRYLNYRGIHADRESPYTSALGEYLGIVSVVQTPMVPEGIIAVTKNGYPAHRKAISIERLADHEP